MADEVRQMKTPVSYARREGFTRIDLAIVVLMVVVVVTCSHYGCQRMREGSRRAACTNNLKYVGIAFRIWNPDSGEEFPFGTSDLTNSHTGILLTSNITTARAWMHFQQLSNRLQNSKRLVCPMDRSRLTNAALDFLAGSNSLSAPSKRDAAVSYLVGLTADETKAQTILTGDRSLAPSRLLPGYSTIANGGAVLVRSRSQWSSKLGFALHDGFGNVGFGDGSVNEMDDMRLRKALQNAEINYGSNANLFLFPQ